MRHHFSAEQWLPFPVETVFALFADPANLPPLMPDWQRARIERSHIVTPPGVPEGWQGVAAGAGTTMTITFRPVPYSPIRIPWDAEITEFVWNEHFCDVQHRGPFAFWRHCHRLRPESRDGRQGTLLRDAVEYALPLGPLGDLANALVGSAQFNAIFRFRHTRTEAMLRARVASSRQDGARG